MFCAATALPKGAISGNALVKLVAEESRVVTVPKMVQNNFRISLLTVLGSGMVGHAMQCWHPKSIRCHSAISHAASWNGCLKNVQWVLGGVDWNAWLIIVIPNHVIQQISKGRPCRNMFKPPNGNLPPFSIAQSPPWGSKQSFHQRNAEATHLVAPKAWSVDRAGSGGCCPMSTWNKLQTYPIHVWQVHVSRAVRDRVQKYVIFHPEESDFGFTISILILIMASGGWNGLFLDSLWIKWLSFELANPCGALQPWLTSPADWELF